jgi:hypothetical protein
MCQPMRKCIHQPQLNNAESTPHYKDLMSPRGVNRLPVKTELQKRLELQATMSLDTRHCRIAALPDNCTTLQRMLTWFGWLET